MISMSFVDTTFSSLFSMFSGIMSSLVHWHGSGVVNSQCNPRPFTVRWPMQHISPYTSVKQRAPFRKIKNCWYLRCTRKIVFVDVHSPLELWGTHILRCARMCRSNGSLFINMDPIFWKKKSLTMPVSFRNWTMWKFWQMGLYFEKSP